MGDTEKTEEIERPQPGEEGPPAVGDPDKVVVTEEDLENEPKPGETPREAEDRKSRRAERRELKETLKETQARLAAAERRLEEMARAPQPQYPAPVQQGYVREAPAAEASPEETEIATIETTQAALVTAIRSCPENQVEGFNRQWQTLERKKQKLISKAAAREAYQEMGGGGNAAETVQTQILQSEFPEIYNNEVLLAYAAAEYKSLIHHHRRPVSPATAREALMNIRQRMRQPTAPAPTDNQKAKYTSTPGRAGASTNGSSGNLTLTKAMMAAARGYTAHLNDLTDTQRAAVWVRDVGKPNGLV